MEEMSEGVYYNESSYPSEAEEGTGLDMASEVACCVCSLTLLDPMTLICGHSFCRHCLARLWHSKSRVSVSKLLCPSCRQPWAEMPAINIQLR